MILSYTSILAIKHVDTSEVIYTPHNHNRLRPSLKWRAQFIYTPYIREVEPTNAVEIVTANNNNRFFIGIKSLNAR